MKRSSFVVETQERITFAYEVAESAPRAAAFAIDVFLEALIALLLLLSTIGLLAFEGDRGGPLGGYPVYVAFVLVVLFAVQWGYSVLFELLSSGQTPGKRLFRLRVVRLDGEPLDPRSIVMRNLLRAADGLPLLFLPLLGGFVTIADPYSRRLGDLVAGTLVVRDKRMALTRPIIEAQYRFPKTEALALPAGRRLDEGELYVLRRFLAGRASLPAARLEALGAGLAGKIKTRLGLVTADTSDSFLEAVYRGHEPVATSAFALPRSPEWEELAALLDLARKKGLRRLGERALRFAELYRGAAGDLAEARRAGLAPDLVDYLNALVGEARARIYALPPLRSGALGRFFARELPVALIRSRRFVLLSALLFLSSLLTSFVLSVGEEGRRAAAFVDRATLDSMLASHSANTFSGRGGGEGSLAAAFYIANNVGIGFLTVATGVFLGAGPLFFVVENGLSLGAISGYVTAKGAGAQIGRFVLAHSVFELTGLILSGACGLLLGWTILKAGRYTRAAALRASMDSFLPLLAAAALLTFLAAFLEAFIATSSLSVGGRALIAGGALLVLVGYFGVYPRLKGLS